MMKFVVNHPYRFATKNQAFMMCFTNYLGMILIEFANISVLLTTGDTLSLLGNFVSLVIVA
jgi:hypothetical protein